MVKLTKSQGIETAKLSEAEPGNSGPCLGALTDVQGRGGEGGLVGLRCESFFFIFRVHGFWGSAQAPTGGLA